jgi:hypothetical protein
MTLDASGNLGIGNTTPDVKLYVQGSNTSLLSNQTSTFAPSANSGATSVKLFNDSSTTGAYTSLEFWARNAVSNINIAYIASPSTSSDNTGTLTFGRRTGGSTSAESMRIDTSGNLLVGITSATSKLTVNGEIGVIDNFALRLGSNQAGGATLLYNNNGNLDITPRLGYNTVVTSGNLLVGGTTNPWGARLVVFATGQALELQTTSSTDPGVEISVNSNGTGQNAITVYSQTAATTTMAVRSNGNIVNTNNSYGAISDAKLKENIVDATPKLAGLMQVKVRNYNLIGDTTKQIGVVAQELETVFPAMIDETPDRDVEGNDLGTKTKSVKYSVFVPMLIKAIQEQQAFITQLTARITALEGA